jgi:hypothetical protein
MKGWIALVMIFVTPLLWAQTALEKLIHGRIIADSAVVKGVNVVNLVNEKETITNENGDFFILAKADDVLVFSASHLEFKRKLIQEEDLKVTLVIVNMIPKITELNEVIVDKKSNDGISIIPGQKKYTPAQRKLYTARSGLFDRPLNWMSGRTAMLKKEVAVERKERLLSKIEVLYEDKFYLETLNIPDGYIRDFQRYAIDDADFVSALNAKNKTMMLFLIGKLAVHYNEILKSEKP